MATIEKDIEIRTEEVQEILGRPPHWLIRCGITVIFTAIAILFIGSYFFKYPEIITAPIEVTIENLSIDSDSVTCFKGKIYLPPQGTGKIKTGQIVNVKLDNFPYMEYGMIKLQVESAMLLPIMQNGKRYYILEIDFPEVLQTNYGKVLSFNRDMQGTAEIVTEDLRLLDRLLRPIRAVLRD
ncbi:MAG: hypothetical protein LBH91_01810 [Prevotellaceae bacterium]|jgi:hypothetical protein|nr:hypothetical protein [Prevotellaceae bacterium]